MPNSPPRYDLAEFASNLATGISRGDPGAIATPSQITQDEWVVQWRSEHPYGYVLTNAATMGQPDRVNIRLVHPSFEPTIANDAQITVRHDRPVADIVQDIHRRLIKRIPELASKSDRIRWNRGFYPAEIEWNDYRRDRLYRIWRAIYSLPSENPLFFADLMVPEESGPSGRVCSICDMEIDINDFSDPQVAYCLGYLTARLDLLEESGELDEMFEDTGTEDWAALLDALTGHQHKIEEPPPPWVEEEAK